MDRKIKIPGYYWIHFSPENRFEINRITEDRPKTYVTDWSFAYSGANKKVNINPPISIGKKLFESKYQLMSNFPREEMPYIIRAIFTNLEILD